MTIVISTQHFAWHDMDECLDRAVREFGLNGVELSWDASFVRPHCTRDDLGRLAALRKRHPASPALAAHIWDNLAECEPTKAVAALREWLRLCGSTGVNRLVIHGGSFANRKEGVARARRVLEKTLPSFEREGVSLNLENHYAYDYRACRELFSEPWEFQAVLSLDSPSLKVCFDTGHGNMTGNSAGLLDALAPWLGYIHLSDNHGVDDEHLPYGRGTVAWPSLFMRLRRLAFDGVFCVEFPVREDLGPLFACARDIRAAQTAAAEGRSIVHVFAGGNAKRKQCSQ